MASDGSAQSSMWTLLGKAVKTAVSLTQGDSQNNGTNDCQQLRGVDTIVDQPTNATKVARCWHAAGETQRGVQVVLQLFFDLDYVTIHGIRHGKRRGCGHGV